MSRKRKSLGAGEEGDVGREMTFQEFIAMVVKQRPENQVSVMDFAELQKCVRKSLRKTDQLIEVLGRKMTTLPSAVEYERMLINAMKPLTTAAKQLKQDYFTEAERADNAELKVATLRRKIQDRGATPVG